MRKLASLHLGIGLIMLFSLWSCSDEDPAEQILISMELRSEVAYTHIDSLVYRSAAGVFEKATVVDGEWQIQVNSSIQDSIGFTVYGEAANLHIQQILNLIELEIKGVYEVNGEEFKVDESRQIEPLTDTIQLNHSLYYHPE